MVSREQLQNVSNGFHKDTECNEHDEYNGYNEHNAIMKGKLPTIYA